MSRFWSVVLLLLSMMSLLLHLSTAAGQRNRNRGKQPSRTENSGRRATPTTIETEDSVQVTTEPIPEDVGLGFGDPIAGSKVNPGTGFGSFPDPSGGLAQQLTCEQRSSCVEASASGSSDAAIFTTGDIRQRNCFCDDLCLTYDDCCHDYERPSQSVVPVLDLNPEVVSCRALEINVLHKDKNGHSVLTMALSNSSTVRVVDRCPSNYSDDFIRSKCQSGDEMFYRLPVNGRTSRVLYRNFYCAVCNGDTNVVYWTVEMDVCAQEHDPDKSPVVPEEVVKMNSHCDPVFVYPEGKRPRPCKVVVDRCPGSWTDRSVVRLCQDRNRTSYVYYGSSRKFRNEHCAICNYVQGTSCVEISEDTDQSPSYDPTAFSLILDLNTGIGGMRDNTVGAGETSVEQMIQLKKCDIGFTFDPFASICRPVFCKKGYKLSESGCLPTDEGKKKKHKTTTDGFRVRSSYDDPRHDPHAPPSTSDSDGNFSLPCPAAVSLNDTEYMILDNQSALVFRTGAIYEPGDYEIHRPYLLFCPDFALSQSYNVTVNVTVTMFKFDRAQGFISFVGVLISLVALLIQFVVYMMFPGLRNIPGKCIVSLVVALFVGQFMFLFVTPSSEYFPGRACFYFAIVMHYGFLAAFFWMNVMAYDVCRTFSSDLARSPSSPTTKRFHLYSLYAWLVPAAIVSLALVMDLTQLDDLYRPHYGDGICWITSRRALLVFFAVPLGLILLTNIVLFAVTVFYICRAFRASQQVLQKTESSGLLLLYIKLSVIMGLTWIFGFLATLTDWTVLWYVFIVFNAFQGAFICIAFVFTKKVFQLLHAMAPPKKILPGQSASSFPSSASNSNCYNKSTHSIATKQTTLNGTSREVVSIETSI